jgi:hypothetical protein
MFAGQVAGHAAVLGLQSAADISPGYEVGAVPLELPVGIVVVAPDRGVLDGAVHPLDLALGPGVIGPGEAVLDAMPRAIASAMRRAADPPAPGVVTGMPLWVSANTATDGLRVMSAASGRLRFLEQVVASQTGTVEERPTNERNSRLQWRCCIDCRSGRIEAPRVRRRDTRLRIDVAEQGARATLIRTTPPPFQRRVSWSTLRSDERSSCSRRHHF